MKHWFIILVFLVGIVLGVGGTFLAPNLVGPYLPEAIKRKGEVVEGSVVAKQRKQNWLLITVNTPQGAILATFKKKVEEIELLVERGDTIGLALRRYEPFVEDPVIKRVRKESPQIQTQPKEIISVPSQPEISIPLPPQPKEIIPIPPKPEAKGPLDSEPAESKPIEPTIEKKEILKKNTEEKITEEQEKNIEPTPSR